MAAHLDGSKHKKKTDWLLWEAKEKQQTGVVGGNLSLSASVSNARMAVLENNPEYASFLNQCTKQFYPFSADDDDDENNDEDEDDDKVGR
jgi:enolase